VPVSDNQGAQERCMVAAFATDDARHTDLVTIDEEVPEHLFCQILVRQSAHVQQPSNIGQVGPSRPFNRA
jgi:hypothetical protein